MTTAAMPAHRTSVMRWPRASRPRIASAAGSVLVRILLGRWDALGSWADAGKLGVVRELLRRRAHPGPGDAPPVHGYLPDRWEEGTGHQVSAGDLVAVRRHPHLPRLGPASRASTPPSRTALSDPAPERSRSQAHRGWPNRPARLVHGMLIGANRLATERAG